MTNGSNIVLSSFTVTAPGTDISFKKAAFSINLLTSGMALSAPGIRLVGAASNIPAVASIDFSGTSCGFTANAIKACVRVAFASEQTTTAATSQTYELRMTVAGAPTGAFTSTAILGDAAFASGALTGTAPALGLGGIERNFLWSDRTAVPHSETSADWLDGAMIHLLPGDPQTLVGS